MRIIGLHSGHDCAYCVLEDGIPVLHEEYERISRLKEGSADALAFYYDRSFKEEDVIFSHVQHQPGGPGSLYPENWNKMVAHIKKNKGLLRRVKSQKYKI